MDLGVAINTILKNKFSISYKNGYNHFRKGSVKFLEVKEVGNYTNIYGRVSDESKLYNTQIRINNDNNKIDLICNCDFCKEVRAIGGNLPCEHIIAMALNLSEKNNKQLNIKREEHIKVILRLEQSFNREYEFKAFLFLEGRGRIKISSRSELEYNVFSEEGIYSLNKIKYSKENKKLFKLLSKMDFKVKDVDIRNLLFFASDSLLIIKVDSLEYEGKIKKELLPLKFTLKNEDDKIRLQTIKSPIKAINKEGTVFIYNRDIYLPPFKQCRAYLPLNKILNKRYYTYVKRESLNKVIKVLKSIGELNINEEVRNIIAEDYKLSLHFYKEREDIYCKLIIPKDSEYLKGTAKVKYIEELLFSNRFTKKEDKYYFLGEDEDLLHLLKSEINNYCEISSSHDFGELGIITVDKLNGEFNKSKSNIEFSLKVDGIEENEWHEAVNDYIDGKDFYRFNNYSFLDFNNSKISELMEFLRFINFKGESINLPIGYEEAFNGAIEKTRFIDFINIDEEEDILIKRKPRGLQATLREYQKFGLQWLQNKKKKGLFGILADEMGLGKTLQTISFILQNRREKTMVITPTSLVYNWEAEFNRFAPDLKVACIHGSKSKRMKYIKNLSKYNVILTSYGTLNMDVECYKNIIFDNLIIDEAQVIKNSKAKVTKSVKYIESKTRFALTGTPIENNYLELWSIFDFLKPGYLFTEKEFKAKFFNNSHEQIEYLKLIIKPFILRRTKSEVLKELPNKIERTFYVEMTEEQTKYYKSSLKKFMKESKETNNSISILSFLTKLRQIALDPSIIDDNYKGGSGKINATLEIIRKSLEYNKKILIFSQFTSLLDKLKRELELLNIEYFYLDGSTKASDRVRLCNEFNEGKEINIFLISLKAGGTGLNLTSAETVIHFDPWWNPAVENQATDRAHRIGQKNEVEVIKIISKNTIEEKIIKLKEEKNNLFSSLLDIEKEVNIKETKLTKEEIEYLLTEEI